MSMMQVFVLNVVFATETTNAPAQFPQRATDERLYINPTVSQPASHPRPKSTKKGRKKRNQKYTKND